MRITYDHTPDAALAPVAVVAVPSPVPPADCSLPLQLASVNVEAIRRAVTARERTERSIGALMKGGRFNNGAGFKARSSDTSRRARFIGATSTWDHDTARVTGRRRGREGHSDSVSTRERPPSSARRRTTPPPPRLETECVRGVRARPQEQVLWSVRASVRESSTGHPPR